MQFYGINKYFGLFTPECPLGVYRKYYEDLFTLKPDLANKLDRDDYVCEYVDSYQKAIICLANGLMMKSKKIKTKCFEIVKQQRPQAIDGIIQGLSDEDYIIAYRCTEKGFYGGEWYSLDKRIATGYKIFKKEPILVKAKIYKKDILTLGIQEAKEVIVENTDRIEILEETPL